MSFHAHATPRTQPSTDDELGVGVLQGKVNDGQITNYGGPAPKGSSHTTGSALLSKPPAARKQWA